MNENYTVIEISRMLIDKISRIINSTYGNIKAELLKRTVLHLKRTNTVLLYMYLSYLVGIIWVVLSVEIVTEIVTLAS